MVDQQLNLVLEATGYLSDSAAAPGTYLGEEAVAVERRRGRVFAPDAMWRGPTALSVYFKFEPQPPSNELISSWRREIWNEGFAPLLWVVSPDRIDLYNGFGRPLSESEDAAAHHLRRFQNIEAQLRELDAFAGRFAMETGQFWLSAPDVSRKTSVDQQLLADLAYLEGGLLAGGLPEPEAHALIGRAIFVKYLIDRRIVRPDRLSELTGHEELSPILRNRQATAKLFAWLVDTFNGNMFPPSATDPPKEEHLARVADFLEATDSEGQKSLFPYQFDVIPIELISSIYEQFAQGRPARSGAKRPNPEAIYRSVHHTPLPLVSLVLDEIMEGLSGTETVLDLACGSAVFLVEALRRLVHRASEGKAPSRTLIRRVLYEQVYGIDISDAAIGVAAFSLYLAALELDPHPHPAEALKFEPLIGKTLQIGDAHVVEIGESVRGSSVGAPARKRFDVIVGNPPWGFRGKAGTEERRQRSGAIPRQPRGEGLDFARRALDYAHGGTRFGFVLPALPFFSASHNGWAAASDILRRFAPATLVNLSNLRSWLFPAAKMPAVVLLAKHRRQPEDQITIVQVPWSAGGARSHTFEISPSDIKKVSTSELIEPGKLKAAAVGHRRDLLLLEHLTQRFGPLEDRLSAIGTGLRMGLTKGGGDHGDVRALRDLPLLNANLAPFHLPASLPPMNLDYAHRPRNRSIYRAPLLIMHEFMTAPGRVVAAVADNDTVYTDTFYGASFPLGRGDVARVLAGILSSSVASWFMAMSAAEFGLGKRRLYQHDIARLPVPDLDRAVESIAASRILAAQYSFPRPASRPSLFGQATVTRPITAFQLGGETTRSIAEAWSDLDEAVFDLYDLDAADRVVVRDGLVRAGWEWQSGLEASNRAPSADELYAYAETFVRCIGAWLSANGSDAIAAQIFDLKPADPLRVVRFVLGKEGQQRSGPDVSVVRSEGALSDVLRATGRRLNVRVAGALVGTRELRVYGADEVIIIKPASYRNWMGVAALDDADAVVAESFAGAVA